MFCANDITFKAAETRPFIFTCNAGIINNILNDWNILKETNLMLVKL